MAKRIRIRLGVVVILLACSFVPALSKGFDANGEKDNGKRK